MLNLVIFGPPGSGKGTQSSKLVEKYGLIHLSTGDILREEIKAESSIGLKIKNICNRGELVPDELVLGELEKRVTRHTNSKGLIFDGFPRTIPQADMLDKMLAKNKTQISLVVAIHVDEHELFDRLIKRGDNSNRADDNEEVIRHRINVYNEQTFPLIEHYKQQGKLVSINGVGSIDVIFERTIEAIDYFLTSK